MLESKELTEGRRGEKKDWQEKLRQYNWANINAYLDGVLEWSPRDKGLIKLHFPEFWLGQG